ncbi:MAG: acetamidase/formamidase family protein [Pseudomonadota bacterium]
MKNLILALCFLFALSAPTLAEEEAPEAIPEMVVVGGKGQNCREDPGCFNRMHPSIPAAAFAVPGQIIRFRTRDAADLLGIAGSVGPDSLAMSDFSLARVHPVTGPVHIKGAMAGDALAVTIHAIHPGSVAWTSIDGGFAQDLVDEQAVILWELEDNYATSEGLPGIRIPNGSFPGVVTTLPGPFELNAMLAREAALAAVGGSALQPDATLASPDVLCGVDGTAPAECLRTIPPREHGGNLDIKHLRAGVTIYLPCFIDGCGLGIGDLHYAQGDGEVGGTAVEMSADVDVSVEIISGGMTFAGGPHFEGPAHLLDIPSTRFYAVTGFPLKPAGSVPPRHAYLDSPTLPPLENLSGDIGLAARNALSAMIDHIVETYGYTPVQAYLIASVAVDLRISQLVDMPNVGVAAYLPLDIFIGEPGDSQP